MIPLLEKWVPGCGPVLIRKGYSMYDTTECVTSAAAVDLLNTLVGHPRFDQANFEQYVKVFKNSVQADLAAVSSSKKMGDSLMQKNVEKALTRLRREFGPKTS